MTRAYKVVFFLTIFTFFLVIVGIFVAAFSPYPTESITFLVFYGQINVYCWLMALAYAPLTTGEAVDASNVQPFSMLSADRPSEAVQPADGSGAAEMVQTQAPITNEKPTFVIDETVNTMADHAEEDEEAHI